MTNDEETRGDFTYRAATHDDTDQIMELFGSTIRAINSKDYTPDEVDDWIACGTDAGRWMRQMDEMHFVVATDRHGKIVGYSAITDEGYLHLMFTHKDYQGKGIATRLLGLMERHAASAGIKAVTSEVSLTAVPFFEHRGYTVDERQHKKARRMMLANCKMSKKL